MNNTRTKNKTLAPLRIFFERNNKVTNTITNLGNVFRNSKWSDLKFQNIKTSHVNNQVYFFITLFLGLFVLNYIILQPTSIVLNTLVYTKRTLTMFLQMIFFLISIYITTILYWITNWFYRTEQKIHNNLFFSNNVVRGVESTNAVVFNNAINDTNSWNTNATQFLNLYKTTNTLHNINHSELINFYNDTTLNLDNNTFMYKIMPILKNSNKDKNLVLFGNDHNFIINSLSSSSFNSIKTYTLTPNDINSLLKSQPDLGVKLFDLKTPMLAAKQDRWLLKNSFITHNVNLSNNANIASKRLLGSNLLNSNLTENNVWASNYLNNKNIAQLSNTLDITNRYMFENYNFFETSKEFTIKRYWNVINMQNIITTQSVVLNNTLNSEPINTNTYVVYSNIMQQTLNNELDMFLIPMFKKPINNNINISLLNHTLNDSNLVLNASEFLMNESLVIINNLPTTNINNLNMVPHNKNTSLINF